jgi:holo-[acyl-carrier protein] synthase
MPKKKSGYYAKRFAAKEALVKAVGIGFTNGIRFIDIAVLNDEYGKPVVFVYHKLKTLLHKVHINISLSDDYPFAMATVILS